MAWDRCNQESVWTELEVRINAQLHLRASEPEISVERRAPRCNTRCVFNTGNLCGGNEAPGMITTEKCCLHGQKGCFLFVFVFFLFNRLIRF